LFREREKRRMSLHYLQHVPFEGLGSIGDWAKDSGHRITCTRFYSGDRP
jgi:GMP synthase (glutamine-hydrolysing)